ncbi:MAG: YaeQ family protein [Acidobacteria bacterium]|nr:YaeQ family protein [Acidobacteriota bacterium]
MALTSTIYRFDIDLADADRHVYESLALHVACHASESEEYLVARVLAYALEYTEGIAFTRGLSEPELPAIVIRDLTGALRSWIEIGAPDAARLHKACKVSPRVVVYMHRDPAQWLRALAGERIHRGDVLELYAIDRRLVGDLVARLDRRVSFALSVTDRELTVSIGTETLTGGVVRCLLD